jgi:hypothetical protein
VIYSHTQPAYAILLLLGGAVLFALVLILAFLRDEVPRGALLTVLAVVLLPAIVIGVLFSSLTVRVTTEDVDVRFGPGLEARRVPLDSIESAEAVQYPWYYGWGIRLTPRGTLYNVSGTRAVLLRLRNGQSVLIGTDQPERLRDALATAGVDEAA